MPQVIRLVLDQDAFKQLKQLRKLWPHVIAAQQSNIVRDAEAFAAGNDQRTGQKRSFTPGTNLAPNDIGRLVKVANLWQFMTNAQRVEILEHAVCVSGAAHVK